ncbi:hypothetical protein J2S19_000854 [Metabacillus malikii]|uniref:Uncharacterized protein n=1 Tax=Metabacillus malikii TaxID=1504265 RepID=A0ABT9ZBG2_9BACI|nr:hypothetical protein [Metabacillus malikii]
MKPNLAVALGKNRLHRANEAVFDAGFEKKRLHRPYEDTLSETPLSLTSSSTSPTHPAGAPHFHHNN